MLIIAGVIILLFVVLVAGTLLASRLKKAPDQENNELKNIASDCCGAHEVCEYDEMLMKPEEIVYYEDEELDRYKGIAPAQFTDSMIEEFREVLYTLQPDEVRKWLLSISRREINLPDILKQEARQLIADHLSSH